MSTPEQGRATQLRNIEAKTGKSLAVMRGEIAASGRVKHGEIRSWLMEAYGLGYGDANGLALAAAADASSAPASEEDVLAAIYSGSKAHLRAIHDAVLAAIRPWGDFEVSPKKGYVSLRRKKQFAMLGPKSAERAELGLNLKDAIASNRIVAQAPGGMCQYIVALRGAEDVDVEVIAALQRAFTAAG
jgi:hypothetical protein